jgi:hypothetical protein
MHRLAVFISQVWRRKMLVFFCVAGDRQRKLLQVSYILRALRRDAGIPHGEKEKPAQAGKRAHRHNQPPVSAEPAHRRSPVRTCHPPHYDAHIFRVKQILLSAHDLCGRNCKL